VREHNIVDIEVEDTDYNDDNDDDSDENEGQDLDENAFSDAGVFDGTSTSEEEALVMAVVVAEVSAPTLSEGKIEGDHIGGGIATVGDGGGSVGSDSGSVICLGSGISSAPLSNVTPTICQLTFDSPPQ
jgi:hypothetical protein